MNDAISTSDRPINVQVVAAGLQKVDKALEQWKRGEIQGVFLMRTETGHIVVKRMPRILED